MKFWTAVVTVSDSITQDNFLEQDKSGAVAERVLGESFASSVDRFLVPDELDQIEVLLKELVARKFHLIVTTGGTGFAPRDVTPEATRRVVDRLAESTMAAVRDEGAKQQEVRCAAEHDEYGIAILVRG